MLTLTKLLSTVFLAVVASGALVTDVTPPGSQGAWDAPPAVLDPNNTATTDTDSIVSTASIVDQKSGAAGATVPNVPVPPVTVTAVDGSLTNSTVNVTSTTSRRSLSARDPSDYEEIFSGSGTGPTDRDASIEGTAFLTFTLVPNATYNVDACLDFCDSVTDCVFANIFYELNNPGLEVLSSNLKCAVYADVHTAAEKLNFGGQQLAPPPAGLTFIQDSSGFAANSLVNPADPEGYELVFGPLDGANNAPGYMGFAFLDRYDVNACAALCNTRGADSQGGACQFFNIWRAVVNGIPTTYTCSMYFIVADASTAVNTGQGDLAVTFSRGYKRINFVIDGGFEDFDECDDFCFDTQDANWIGTSAPGGTLDATIFFFQPYAHSGNAVALLGSATAEDSLPGTLTVAQPLNTVAGNTYSINFFQASAFSGPTLEANAFVDILWNNQIVATINPGFENYVFYQFTVTAAGNDILAFHGGAAPAWSFIDDVSVFQQ